MPSPELRFAVCSAVSTPTGQMPADRDAAYSWFYDRADKTIRSAALRTLKSANPVSVPADVKRQAIQLAFDHVWEDRC